MGPAYDFEPRSVTHLMFLPLTFFFGLPMSHSAGRPLTRVLAMLRLGEPPNIRQPSVPPVGFFSAPVLSPAPERPDRAPITTTPASTAAVTTAANQRRKLG